MEAIALVGPSLIGISISSSLYQSFQYKARSYWRDVIKGNSMIDIDINVPQHIPFITWLSDHSKGQCRKMHPMMLSSSPNEQGESKRQIFLLPLATIYVTVTSDLKLRIDPVIYQDRLQGYHVWTTGFRILPQKRLQAQENLIHWYVDTVQIPVSYGSETHYPSQEMDSIRA